MTETITISVESEDLKEFNEKTGMSLAECIKILINSVKYGGKLFQKNIGLKIKILLEGIKNDVSKNNVD